MDSYILSLKQYICEKHMYQKLGNKENLLEQIWCFHSRYHPLDSDMISCHFAELKPELKPISQKKQRKVKRMIIELCEEHERLAYIKGICTGVRLAQEIDAIIRDLDMEEEKADCHTSLRTGSQ